MNPLITTDAYHLTMGYLIGDFDALALETHILYARTGGPLVVPDLHDMVEQYLSWRITPEQVAAADQYWTAHGVPFNRHAADRLAAMDHLPISVRGVPDGEVVRPGEPIAVFKAPAIIAAIPEPLFISQLMNSVQVATRFTKIAKALNWQTQRLFEVGMRADRGETHEHNIKLLARLGLQMTSSGNAALAAGIRCGGSMGHRYTQRFCSDYAAFMQAVDRMLAFRQQQSIEQKVKLSFLLDTRNTLESGLQAALQVIEQRYEEVKNHIDLSVRLDSGDLAAQLKVIISTFLKHFDSREFMPAIIVESGLTASDIERFEAIAKGMHFPLSKMLYGVGGYLVGGINRDFVSMVYKVSSYDNGIATMKFADEAGQAKESYPGEVTLVERLVEQGVERQIALLDELDELTAQGWRDCFIRIAEEGHMIATKDPQKSLQTRIKQRWETIAGGYMGDEKYPAQFVQRPAYSAALSALVKQIKQQQC